MTPITIHGLTKRFGRTVAVDGLDLEIPAGSLFFLLGPSGCGKTTLLRMIAGLAESSAGTIQFGDRDITNLAAHDRNCGMMFQSYALWPHMTVWQNVGFGLDVRRIATDEKTRRIEQALQRVQMTPYAKRRPNALSGGQQQRVALARALVIEPTVLLLDEPLSNLDAKLRLDMRATIRQICDDARITSVYVTHDQKEALSMADQIALMDEGKIRQVGTPRELYERPLSRFVADFLGQTNFVPAEVVERDGTRVKLQCAAGAFVSTGFSRDMPSTGNVTCSIRPEAIQIRRPGQAPPTDGLNHFDASIKGVLYSGEAAEHQLVVNEHLSLTAYELNPRASTKEDERVEVYFHPQDVAILQD